MKESKSEIKDQQIESLVDKLYDNMSIDERVAQLHGVYLDTFFDKDGQLDEEKCQRELANGVGHFSQFCVTQRKQPDQLRDMVAQMQNWLKRNTHSAIPALFHDEVLTGIATYGATIYPQQIGLACSFNPQLAETKTRQTSTDFRRIGAMLALSPMVDVVRTPSFNRLEESYGEDAYLSSQMGVAFVKGLQQGDLRKGVAACTKHFLGYGGGGDANEKELMEEILMPHETIIRLAGSRVLMTGYHAVDGTKCVASANLQQKILRDYLHFDGMTVSDYGSVNQLPLSDAVECASAAINAGNDVDFPTGDSYKSLPKAMELGMVGEETLARAVKDVLRIKARVGMLDPDAVLYDNGHITLDSAEERETAYTLATQSVVLLKNNGVLPIKKKTRIALVGPNADTMWAMLGDYTYPSMRYFWQLQNEDDKHPKIVNLFDGLTNRLPEGCTLDYECGCDWTEEVETTIEDCGDERAAYMRKIQNRKIDHQCDIDQTRALMLASNSDVVIAAMGENVILCGENRDRTTLRLPGRQEEFVRKLLATGKPVVLLMFGGRAQVISDLADKCAAVIQAWYPGEEGGDALADIIYGNISPSGKLSVSYPAVEWHKPLCYNQGLEGDDRIAYPFGHGLTYTTFQYSDLNISPNYAITDKTIHFTFKIGNTGNYDADEIAQIYLSPVSAEQKIRPIQLQGFCRVHLDKGQTTVVSVDMSPQQFGYYEEGQWNVSPGKFVVKIGASSADIRLSATIELTGNSLTMPLRTEYFSVVR